MFDQDEDHSHSLLSNLSRFSKGTAITIVAGLLCLVFAAYAFHEHRVSADLTAQNGQLTASLQANKTQIDKLATTVGELTAAREAQTQPVAVAPAAAEVKPSPVHRTALHRTARAHRRADDSRFRKMQAQLDAQGKEINDTRNDLTSTRTELTGSIAKTHGELVVLEKKGERNYYEFDINKSKEYQHHGEVGIRLRKANTKHQYADLELMVDDRDMSQKHVNLYQPVMFYTPDSPQPVELVINDITKNHIHGYVSASKYRQSELSAMANANGQTDADDSQAQAPARQKLTVPQQ